ncbi:hypothetical protein VTI74DRAFT_2476 [Chaetomium olivicolor]
MLEGIRRPCGTSPERGLLWVMTTMIWLHDISRIQTLDGWLSERIQKDNTRQTFQLTLSSGSDHASNMHSCVTRLVTHFHATFTPVFTLRQSSSTVSIDYHMLFDHGHRETTRRTSPTVGLRHPTSPLTLNLRGTLPTYIQGLAGAADRSVEPFPGLPPFGEPSGFIIPRESGSGIWKRLASSVVAGG